MQDRAEDLAPLENKPTPEEAFVNELIRNGAIEINTPPDLGPRKFAVSYRTARNPLTPTGTIDRSQFHKLSKFLYGYTTTQAIDLFEIVTTNGQQVYIPIGHIDYDIARLSDGTTLASGNLLRHRKILSTTGPIPRNGFFNPYELADDNLGVSAKGIEILGESNETSSSYERGIREKLKEVGIASDTSWRGHGFGNLLQGVGFEVLRHEGVDEIDFGDVSAQLKPVLAKVGYSDKVNSVQTATIPPVASQSMFSSFVPQRLQQ